MFRNTLRPLNCGLLVYVVQLNGRLLLPHMKESSQAISAAGVLFSRATIAEGKTKQVRGLSVCTESLVYLVALRETKEAFVLVRVAAGKFQLVMRG